MRHGHNRQERWRCARVGGAHGIAVHGSPIQRYGIHQVSSDITKSGQEPSMERPEHDGVSPAWKHAPWGLGGPCDTPGPAPRGAGPCYSPPAPAPPPPPLALRHAAPGGGRADGAERPPGWLTWSAGHRACHGPNPRRCPWAPGSASKRHRCSSTVCNVAAETRPQASGLRRSLAMEHNASQTI